MFNVIVLGLTSLLTDISTEMVYPLLPFFLTSTLGAGPATIGLIEGIAESVASFLKVVSGHFSDRMRRRKPFAILGYAFSTAGKVLLSLASTWNLVLAGRVADRFGKGIRTAPRDALITESIDESRRGFAFGLHRMMDTIGAAGGVLIALAFIQSRQNDYTTVILWSIVPATLGVLLLLLVRERVHDDPSGTPLPPLRWHTLPRRLRHFLLIVFVFSLGNSSNTFLLLRAHDVGFTPAGALILYLVYNLTYALLSLPAGKLSDRIGRKTLLVGGYALYGGVYLGFALLAGPGHSWILWFLFAAYGAYSAMTEGIERALVSDLSPGTLRGSALGLHATLVGVGLLPASLVAGQLWQLAGPGAPFLLGGCLSLAAAAALFLAL